jgi:hypothetical protein
MPRSLRGHRQRQTAHDMPTPDGGMRIGTHDDIHSGHGVTIQPKVRAGTVAEQGHPETM